MSTQHLMKTKDTISAGQIFDSKAIRNGLIVDKMDKKHDKEDVKEESEREEGELISESDEDGNENESATKTFELISLKKSTQQQQQQPQQHPNQQQLQKQKQQQQLQKQKQQQQSQKQKTIDVIGSCVDDIIDLTISEDEINLIGADEDNSAYTDLEEGEVEREINTKPTVMNIKSKELQNNCNISNKKLIPDFMAADEMKFSKKLLELQKQENTNVNEKTIEKDLSTDDPEDGEIRSPNNNDDNNNDNNNNENIQLTQAKISDESKDEQPKVKKDEKLSGAIKKTTTDRNQKNEAANKIPKNKKASIESALNNDRLKSVKKKEVVHHNVDVLKANDGKKVKPFNGKQKMQQFKINEKTNDREKTSSAEVQKSKATGGGAEINPIGSHTKIVYNNEKLRKLPDAIENAIIRAAKDVNLCIADQICFDFNIALDDEPKSEKLKTNENAICRKNTNEKINDKVKAEPSRENAGAGAVKKIFESKKIEFNRTIQYAEQQSIAQLHEIKPLAMRAPIDPTVFTKIFAPITSKVATYSCNINAFNVLETISEESITTINNKISTHQQAQSVDDAIDDGPLAFFGPNWLFPSPKQLISEPENSDQSPSPRLYRKEQRLKTFGYKERQHTRRPKPYEKPQTETVIRKFEKTTNHVKYFQPQPYCPYTTRARIPPYCITLYDENGRLRRSGADICDCGNESCYGCWYNCFECGSQRCGLSCRCNRQVYPDNWIMKQSKRTNH